MSHNIRTVPQGGSARRQFGRVVFAAAVVLAAACSGDAVSPLVSGPSFDSQTTSLATPAPSVAVSGSTVTVSWPAVPNADEYQVNTSGQSTPKTTATSVVYTNVPNGAYTVKVRALTTRSHNESGWSGDVSFTVAVADLTPPTEPTPPAADNTPPVIGAPVITGTLGNNGWYTSDVTVTWTATDSESAVTLAGCSVSVTTNTAGTTYTCTATSAGGTATASITIKRDDTRPTVTAQLAGTLGNGWYVTDVGVSFIVIANGPSGLGASSGCDAASVTSDGTFSSTCTAQSGAGLSNSATASGKRDATVPGIAFSGIAGSYTVDQTVNITCSATDAMSLIATTSCPAVVAGDAYTFNVGILSNVFTASATDNAGNGATATTSFTVSVTSESLCNLTERFVSHTGIANSLCVKLNAAAAAAARGNLQAKAGPLGAYVEELQAQSGKAITADNAAILINLVRYL